MLHHSGPPNVLIATGFGKWGFTNGSAVAAQILSGMIVDEVPDWARPFAPRLPNSLSGWKTLAMNNAGGRRDTGLRMGAGAWQGISRVRSGRGASRPAPPRRCQ